MYYETKVRKQQRPRRQSINAFFWYSVSPISTNHSNIMALLSHCKAAKVVGWIFFDIFDPFKHTISLPAW